jgi:hypothetical protein
MATKLSFSVGRQRLGRNVRPSEARYTRAVKAQMDQIIRNAQKVIESINATSVPGLEYALKPIYDSSQMLVPVRTGRLKRSGFIEVRRTRRGVTGTVGYAKGGSPHYAVYVHENMEMYHNPPTQAKFLQAAIMQHLYDIPIRYAEYVRFTLGL